MAGIQSYISRAKKDLGYSDIDTGPSSTKKEKKLKNRDGKDFVPTRKKVSMGKITTMKSGGITTGKKMAKQQKNVKGQGQSGGTGITLVRTKRVGRDMTEAELQQGPTYKSKDNLKNRKKNVGKKADGGSLKSVPADNKGLSKLPQPVRNKMGYMKNGGVVKMRGGGAATQGMNFNRGY